MRRRRRLLLLGPLLGCVVAPGAAAATASCWGWRCLGWLLATWAAARPLRSAPHHTRHPLPPPRARRFRFFCESAQAYLRARNVRPDILHCHDWQTAPIAWGDKDNAKTVFTIHNLNYGARQRQRGAALQGKGRGWRGCGARLDRPGLRWRGWCSAARRRCRPGGGLSPPLLHPARLPPLPTAPPPLPPAPGAGADLVGKAMSSSQVATTVSPTYAREISGHPAVAPNLGKLFGIRCARRRQQRAAAAPGAASRPGPGPGRPRRPSLPSRPTACL